MKEERILFEVVPRVSPSLYEVPTVVYDCRVWAGTLCLFSQSYLNKEEAIANGRKEALRHKMAMELENTLDEPYVEEV